MTEHERALWVQAKADYAHALLIAQEAWGVDPSPTDEALQAAAATILIHITKLRDRGVTPAAPTAVKRERSESPQASVAALAIPSACPACGGEIWDNRLNKKNPKAPDWKCKSKTCLDAKGFVTAGWVTKPGGKALATATTIRNDLDSFAQKPAVLEEAEDDLPF